MTPDTHQSTPVQAARPLPPARTLRGEPGAGPRPGRAFIAPVRSGLIGAPVVTIETAVPAAAGSSVPVTPEPAVALDRAVTHEPEPQISADPWSAPALAEELEIVPEPDATAELKGHFGTPALAEAEAEIILDDEVLWVDDLGVTIDAIELVEPVEAVPAAADESAPTAADFESGPDVAAADDFEPGLFGGEDAIEIELLADPDEIDSGLANEVADLDVEAVHHDPADIASHLERLADRLRMHGSQALHSAREAGDPVESAIAAALVDMLEKNGL